MGPAAKLGALWAETVANVLLGAVLCDPPPQPTITKEMQPTTSGRRKTGGSAAATKLIRQLWTIRPRGAIDRRSQVSGRLELPARTQGDDVNILERFTRGVELMRAPGCIYFEVVSINVLNNCQPDGRAVRSIDSVVIAFVNVD